MTDWRTDPEGDRAVRFINNLTLVHDQSGKPMKLRPWQEEIVRRLFGTRNRHGRRQYRRFFFGGPRKIAKTTLMAAILLCMLFDASRQGQYIISASCDRKTAAIIFNIMVQMLKADPYLSSLCTIFNSNADKRIVVDALNNTFEARPAGYAAKKKLGDNPTCVLFDEFSMVTDRAFHDTLTSGYGTREEPLTIYLTNAGTDPDTIGYEYWQHAVAVQKWMRDPKDPEGIEDPTLYPVVYAADPALPWDDEATWYTCMPPLGDFLLIENMREELQKTKTSPSYVPVFKRLFLSQWTSDIGDKWLNPDTWDKAKVAGLKLEDFKGCKCFGAFDLSANHDITCFLLMFEKDGEFFVFPWFWVPERAMKNRDKINLDRYESYVKRGCLTLTPGDTIDHERMAQEIVDICAEYKPASIMADSWSSSYICATIKNHGYDVRYFRQGLQSMNEPSHYFERLVSEGKIRHDGNRCLRWMVSNVRLATDKTGTLIKPDKPSKGSPEKIDGVVCCVMALARWLDELHTPQLQPSITILRR